MWAKPSRAINVQKDMLQFTSGGKLSDFNVGIPEKRASLLRTTSAHMDIDPTSREKVWLTQGAELFHGSVTFKASAPGRVIHL